ncbi:PREDICTED: probable mediator of RNA polymerase II transcription subunit 26c isoform X2 [Tarenaya hassleriana]|uniref:probable mediator of RNA polymerase II transcription subunit 26c isoform X2 n=1 Tax=Tarenaya hassleriana TaxID=28532 RepID=UPI00053C6252|nr:PREDICTED: probable mediator of RNA polymerase II transcription subunit 26c isoform X2 [Tarenaya hassleriana]
MDLDDFRSILGTAGVDVWAFIDTAILVASLDYGHELKCRRDNIVERLYATSMVNRCRNCEFCGGGGGGEVRVDEEEEGKEHDENNRGEVEKSGNGDNDDGFDPYAGLFDDEQKMILEIKEKLNDPDLSEESLVELLQSLADMDITVQALQETDIGRHVNRVRKHSSNNVRRLARQLLKKWMETVDEWVKHKQPGDLEPSNLIADGDSPQQKAPQNGDRQQVLDFGYSPVPHSEYRTGFKDEYSGPSKKISNTEPERKPRPAAPPPARPARPSPAPQTGQREKEPWELNDFDSARKRLQQNYREAENVKKQRTIQVMDIHEIPKPKRAFFPKKGGSSHGRHF